MVSSLRGVTDSTLETSLTIVGANGGSMGVIKGDCMISVAVANLYAFDTMESSGWLLTQWNLAGTTELDEYEYFSGQFTPNEVDPC